MFILAIANQKGGTGKTSTTVNLAAALARARRRVLLVDFDPQASLTEYFVDPADVYESIYDALLDGRTLTPRLVPLASAGALHLLPATIDLAAAELQLPARRNAERALARVLKPFTEQYDECLIDCPPSLGVLTTNALTAADAVLVPVATELMAERTIKLILATIVDVRDSELNATLTAWRILPSLYDGRLAHHREVLAALQAKYGALVYPEPVKATTKYKDAVTSQVDVAALDAQIGAYWDRLATLLVSEREGVTLCQ